MEIRPEAEVFPMGSDDELKKLAANIDKYGQLESIKTFGGAILDGRRRFTAITKYCKAGTKPRFEAVKPDSLIAYVVSENRHRRHLRKSQWAACAVKAKEFYEAEGRKRKSEGGKKGGKIAGRGRPKPIGTAQICAVPIRSSDQAGEEFGIAGRMVDMAVTVHGGAKKVFDAVFNGDVSVERASRIVKQNKGDKKEQERQLALVSKSNNVTRVKGLTGEVEWYTPREYLDSAVAVMGRIDLDPASSHAAQKHVKADAFYTIEKDGLVSPWSGRVFLNPPYKMPEVAQFTRRLAEQYKADAIKQGILLVNNATDTEWFHYLLPYCSALCLTRGRISFIQAKDGELMERCAPTHGQIFVYFGNDVEKFSDVFSQHGAIVNVLRPAVPK